MSYFGTSVRSMSALALAAAMVAPPALAQEQQGADVQLSRTQELSNWVGALALQAATYAAPIVAMYNLRSAVAVGPHPKAAPNTLWRLEDISTPKLSAESGYVSPNVNVVYGFGFADLGAEPVILTVPDSDGLYYMVEIVDMWTNAFAYPAGKIAGYKGGKYALVGPGWKGTLPEGVTRIEAPTRWIELQPRVHVTSESELDRARKVLNGVTLQTLSHYTGGAAPASVVYNYEVPDLHPGIASSHFPFNDPVQFWTIFSAAMNENPPPANEIAAVLPQFRYLGIELGKQWKPSDVNPPVLAEMKKAAQQIAPIALATMPIAGKLDKGWVIPPANTGLAGTDYLSRADVAVFGLTANTPTEAIYYSGILDGNNQPMTGAKNYTMTLKPPMAYATPVPPGFWSVTMYDKTTSYSVPNAINRYSLGSDNKLKTNADGSVMLYLQVASPGKDKESNWLPAPPGPFYLIMRNYAPIPSLTDGLKNLATFEGPPGVFPVASK